jgi:hypothetical protein
MNRRYHVLGGTALALASLVVTARPAFAEPILTVTTSVVASGDASNPFRYIYTLTNDSTCTPAPCVAEDLIEFSVPIFGGVNDFDPASVIFTREDSFVFAPGPYFYDPTRDPVLAANPGAYGPNPAAFAALTSGINWVFHRTPLLVGESMTLEFNSAYAPTAAPYFAVWGLGTPPNRTFSETNSGTILIPNSPAYQATQSIPEPSSLLLLAPAAAMAWHKRRKPRAT